MSDPNALAAVDLKTEYLVRPLGLDTSAPRFSWRLESPRTGVRQSAYRIEAAASLEALLAGKADVWDSGCIVGERPFDIAYGGRPLASGERIFWRVQVWDETGAPSPPCTPSWFEMGLLSPSDWRGNWLTAQTGEEAADRGAGLHWIWKKGKNDGKPVKFRFAFTCEAKANAATLLLSVKDNLLGVWLNGCAVALPKAIAWGTMLSLPLEPVAGDNILAIEASALTDGFMPADGGALAALIRVADAGGAMARLSSSGIWRVATVDGSDWIAPDYDDRDWPLASAAQSRVRCEPWPAGPAVRLRRVFSLDKPVARARLYATALGLYEAELNGARIGDGHLTPEVSVAEDHLFYQCYDVTKYLRRGRNALGATVGDGWIAGAFGWRCERFSMHDGPKRFLAQLDITYTDGSRETVATDANWRTGDSPILSAEIYNGETFDARLDDAGWSLPEFDDAAWLPAEAARCPAMRLVAQPGPLIRRMTVLPAVRRSEPLPGIFVFDFGQNFSGWARLYATGKSGDTVTLRYGELLNADGSLDQSNLRFAAAVDRYTLRGAAGGEVYEPRFTYHGFRYVSVEGADSLPFAVEGIVAHTDAPAAGNLRIENILIQRIVDNACWSQRSNFFGVPTDCPQRDERMGWAGDIQVFLDAAAFNMDVDAFIRRYLWEMRAGQTAEGAYPVVTPQPRSFAPMWTAGWSEAGVILPWTLYRRYGDTAVIVENWEAMTRWMDFLSRNNPDCLWQNARGLDLGDWLSVDAVQPADETTPRALVATAYWAYAAQLMAEMAAAIGREAQSAHYCDLRKKIVSAFGKTFVRDDGTVGNGSQTGHVLALHFGLVPARLRPAAAAKLVAEIEGRGTKLSTGFLGTPYLIDVLLDTGQTETAIRLLLQTKYPSWGYMVAQGATTMWERWNSDIGDLSMNSYNHYAFGAIVGTLYRRFAGIAPAAPGFSEILVDPVFDVRIGRVRAEYHSQMGCIVTDVNGDGSGVNRLKLTVPSGATAKVLLPKLRFWREGERPLADRADMKLEINGALAVHVGSGVFDFRAE